MPVGFPPFPLLTPGSVVFAGAGGTPTQDNVNFFWDDSNNRLGVGTAAPSTTLHVTSAVTAGTDLNIASTDTGGKSFQLLSTGSASGYGAGRLTLWDGSTYALLNYTVSSNVLALNSTEVLGWSTDGYANAAADAGLARQTTGIVEVNTGTKGSLGKLAADMVTLSNVLTIDATVDVVITTTSSNTSSTAFILNNSSTGGHNFQFFSTGSANNPGFFGVYDATSNVLPLAIGGTLGNVQLRNTGVLAWTAGASANSTTIDTGLARNAAGAIEINNGTAGTLRDLKTRDVYINDANFMLRSTAAWNNGAAAALGTLANAPAAGNPTKWIPIDDNGTTRYIPAW